MKEFVIGRHISNAERGVEKVLNAAERGVEKVMEHRRRKVTGR